MRERSSITVTVLVDIALPIIVYYVLQGFGVAPALALCAGGAVSGIGVVIGVVRRRRVDAVALIVLVLFALGLLTSLLTGDGRFVLVKDSLLTGVFGVAFLVSLVGRPLVYFLLMPVLTAKNPASEPFWRQAWREGLAFRHAMRILALGWGLGLLADSVVRVLIVYLLPVDVAVVPAQVLLVVAVPALVAWSGWYAKRTGLGIREWLNA
ncbi:hypothetical protein GCM10022419_129950 [Nonomuraea rosea]|uniref:DUF3159 domain-containing protein n=1 Tax=Nonomuraea rosea TaxID=638574 RepID=A0ABP6ZXS9_9ACTN